MNDLDKFLNNLDYTALNIDPTEFKSCSKKLYNHISLGQTLQNDEYIRIINYFEQIINDVNSRARKVSDEEFDEFKEIYSIYRDHIKHEDTLGNQRLSYFIASQSFLFFPYFATYKDYRANGYNGFDCTLLVMICVIGFLLSFSSRNSVRAFVVAADEIAKQWKTNYWHEKDEDETKECPKFSWHERTEEIKEKDFKNSIAFIKIKEKVIPNIRYETNSKFLLRGIRYFAHRLPVWFMGIWGLLFSLTIILSACQFGLEEQTKVDIYKSLTETRQELKMKEKASEDTIENLTALQNQLNTSQKKTSNLMIKGRNLKTNLDNKERQNLDFLEIIIQTSCQAQIDKEPNFKNESVELLTNKETGEVTQYLKEKCNK